MAFALTPCFGQSGRGGLSGTISDNSGAVIAGASVELVDTATNITRKTQTSSSGLYSFPELVPGTYNLSVTFQGFQKTINNSVPIDVDRVTTVNVALVPGQLTQSVDVTDTAAPLLNTNDSTIGSLINNKTIESVPLNGRNLFLLVQLSPSVTPGNGALNATGEGNRPGIGVSAYRINGQPEGSLAYNFDGSPLTVTGYGTAATSPALTPALESTQEFRLETNNTSATVDSHGSGVLSVVSRSGTDKFHGSAFYYNRPDALSANDPFNKASQLRNGEANTPPDFHRTQTGGSIGGPIKKDKLFFFGDYEYTRATSLSNFTSTVPTAAERTGDFSDIPQIYNPFNINAANQRVPFTGNIIPGNLLNPVALNVQKYLPLPNQAGEGAYHSNNYFNSAVSPNDADKFDVRLDWYASSKQQIFGRYSFADTHTGQPDHFGNGADPSYYSNFTRGQNVLLADNVTLSPTTLLQLRYTFTRHAESQPVSAALGNVSLTDLGFPAALAAQQDVASLPSFNISGISGVGSGTYSTGFQYIAMEHDAIIGVNMVRGKHDVKFGFEYRKDLENVGQPIAPSGNYSFDATATSSTTFANNGYGFASFLLGQGSPFQSAQSFTRDPFLAEESPYYASYIEDTFHATPRLTLTAGLRWDVLGGRTERYNRLETFDFNTPYVINGVTLRGGERFAQGGSSPFTTNYRDFAPRLGLAYRITDHLLFHAGGGVFYGPTARGVATPFSNSDSFASQTAWNAATIDANGNAVQVNPLNNPFPNGLTPPTQGSAGLATNLGSVLQTAPRTQPDARAYNWNGGLQYEFPHGYVISASYVGARGLHQILGNGSSGPDLNQLSLDQIAQYNTQLANRVPNPYVNAITNPSAPFYGSATIPQWLALAPYPQFSGGYPNSGVSLNGSPLTDSNYHAGLLRVEKRLGAHFSTQASFTFSKVISDGALGAYFYGLSNASYQDWRNLKIERSVDAQDVSRSFTWAAFYELPVGRNRALNTQAGWLNAIIGNWTVNGVLSFATGIPLVDGGAFTNGSQYFNQRPNLVCDPSQGAPHTAQQWFSPTCFAAPASPYLPGNAPRTLPTVRADGIHNLDLSFFKNFPFTEATNLQLRVEFFNFTNSVQLGLPNAFYNQNDLSTFGQITSAASTPRQVQFGARFTF